MTEYYTKLVYNYMYGNLYLIVREAGLLSTLFLPDIFSQDYKTMKHLTGSFSLFHLSNLNNNTLTFGTFYIH